MMFSMGGDHSTVAAGYAIKMNHRLANVKHDRVFECHGPARTRGSACDTRGRLLKHPNDSAVLDNDGVRKMGAHRVV